MALTKSLFFILPFFLLGPIFAQTEMQNTVSLEAEIARLENLARGAAGTEQHNALMTLTRLHQLSGNTDAQLETLARVVTLFPNNGQALVEQARLFISIGEFENAAATAAALLSREKEYLLMGRFLLAQVEAFRSGNTRLLAALAVDPDFSAHKSAIFYTLWKLSDDQYYRERLTTEFPQSPEARIIANTASSSPTPLWLLFPGRDSIRLAEPLPVAPTITAPVVTSPPAIASPPVVTAPPATQAGTPYSAQSQRPALQTGLFGREANARAMADRLARAGFQASVSRRNVNGSAFWAVTVPGGNDMNATIQRLRAAGFESFPVR